MMDIKVNKLIIVFRIFILSFPVHNFPRYSEIDKHEITSTLKTLFNYLAFLTFFIQESFFIRESFFFESQWCVFFTRIQRSILSHWQSFHLLNWFLKFVLMFAVIPLFKVRGRVDTPAKTLNTASFYICLFSVLDKCCCLWYLVFIYCVFT